MRPRLLSFEQAWTDAAFDAIFPDLSHEKKRPEAPDEPTLPHGIAELHPARFFDAMLADIPLEQSLGLRVALWIVALAPLFTLKKLATIATLRKEERGLVLERLLASPIYVVRQLAISLKAMATMLYASSPRITAAMNVPRGKKPRLTQLRLAKHKEDGHDHAAE